ncbi:metal ABC transporter permease [Treponema parvum]|uniref:metal ABC transporter permease n=1 Tax=Treponema parvum TaxID=138851 RepID=UPI001AEC4FF1|nr:metal ABC transporter permease [Treponema parvum]QTQ17121.1 metal ABC transporter permease [Treponema parvum]
MADILQTLKLYFTFPFVQYAMIAGVLIALCSSLLGVTLVLKRFSYIGDGLSHVAFGALSVATVLKLSNNMFLILPATVICAIILLSTGRNAKIKGDAAVAMLSVSALAVGYFLVNMFSASANISGDVCTTLFGSTSILTLTKTDVYLCVVLSMLVIAVFLLFYHKIFSVTFDENFARATGIKTNVYNLIIAIIIAVVIVLAMNLVGSLLISALIVFPSLSSMRLFKNFKSVIIFSALVSVLCSVFGIVFSILLETPVGATIVITDLLVFLICRLIEKLKAVKKI